MSTIDNEQEKNNSSRIDSDKVSQKDLYNELWHGRDLEIQTLWQRSIFLTAFLVLVFSGYGLLWLKCIELTPQPTPNILLLELHLPKISFFVYSHSLFNWFGNIPPQISLSLGILASLGLFISLLWIMMAKGAKYWVEKYENGIDQVLNSDKLYKMTFNDIIVNNTNNINSNNRYPKHGKLLEPCNVNNNLISTNGGTYSVSRINILIGHVSGSFFCLAIILHFFSLWMQIGCISIFFPLIIIFASLYLMKSARSR